MRALAWDPASVPLEEDERAMLEYALLLTRAPHAAANTGVATMRAAGWSDRAILDVCQITSYYNYVNRLAEGLDVQLESSWTEESLTMTRAEFDAHRTRVREEAR